jgi:hypothetical protein
MSKHTPARTLIAAFCVTLAGCSAMREGMEGHKDAVAVAEGYTLTVEHAAELLAMASDSIWPAEVNAVDRLADLWVSYTLLAKEFLKENDFADVDVEPLDRLNRTRQLVTWLADDVRRERSGVNDVTLRSWYERDQPFAVVQTHHILIRVPVAATPTMVDSVARFAERLRQRIGAGESFEELARQYSEDPGSARFGGNLGWIRRGQLVPEIDGIIFDMQMGEISDVVRSSFGFHIVKVTDRQAPDFETARSEYEANLLAERSTAIEDAFIDSVLQAADLTVPPGVGAVVRSVARFPARLSRLGPAQRRRVLVHYGGGTLTMGEWADDAVRDAPNTQARLSGSNPAAVEQYLGRLAMTRLLADIAARRGHVLPEETEDSLAAAARSELELAARSAFRSFQPLEGDPVMARVNQAFEWMFVRRQSSHTLDRVAPALRQGTDPILINVHRYGEVVQRLEELRSDAAGRAVGAAERQRTEVAAGP